MSPTTKLRFVERTVQVPFQDYKDVTESKTVHILQQWWEQSNTMNLGWGEIPLGEAKGEWRDVPLEKETT